MNYRLVEVIYGNTLHGMLPKALYLGEDGYQYSGIYKYIPHNIANEAIQGVYSRLEILQCY